MTLELAKLLGARALPVEDSQCWKILEALHAVDGQWLTLPFLYQISGSYNVHSRISDLRKMGFVIENDTDNSITPHQSKYRLVTAAMTPAPAGGQFNVAAVPTAV